MATANYAILQRLLVNFVVLLACLLLFNFLTGRYTYEGFVPFQAFYQQFIQAQNQANSYNNWVGYAYRTANTTSTAEVLNDFKQRVFHPSCTFKDNWPSGASPNGAANATAANISYSAFLKCLNSGSQSCYGKLEDARQRFMQPGCTFRNPINSAEPITAAFK